MKNDKSTMMEKARAQIARAAGLDPAQVDMSRVGMFDLTLSQGLAVRISVHGTSMFEVTCPDELVGLAIANEAEEQYRKRHIRAPRFDLTGREASGKVSSLSRSARNYLARVKETIGFELETGWVWIPFVDPAPDGTPRGFEAVRDRLEEYRQKYNRYIDFVARNRGMFLHRTLVDIRGIAETLYKRINHIKHDRAVDVPQKFVDGLRQFAIAAFPSEEEIKDCGGFEIFVKAYAMPSTIAADKLAVEAKTERQRMLLAEQARYLQAERERKEAELDNVLRGIAVQARGIIQNVVDNVTKALNRDVIPNTTLRQARELANTLAPLFVLIGQDADLQNLAECVSTAAKAADINASSQKLESSLAALTAAINDYTAALGCDAAEDFVDLS